MLRILTVFLMALLALRAEAQTPLADLPLGNAAEFTESTHIIVTARLPAGQSDVDWAQDLANRNSMTVVAIWPLRSIDILCFVFAVPGDTASVLDAISQEAEVEFAYPIQPFETLSSAKYRDQFVQLQGGAREMGVWSAHMRTKGGGVTVALVDTAVAVGHSDLSNQSISQRDFVSRSPPTDLAETHGTAMAAIILADAKNGQGMVGVAPDATMLALRACWEEKVGGKGRCNTFSLARALNFAILNDANVINLSLTGPSDPILEQLLASALRRGIAVVIAAPTQTRNALGLNLPGVILANARPSKGSVLAPGVEVLSAKPANDYDFFSGASVSAAHVTGAMALLRAAKPDAALGEMSAALAISGDGANGAISVCRALQALNEVLDGCD